jgi:hypothetical protein
MSDSDLFKEAYAILMSARTAIEPSNAPCPELNLESLTRDILVVIDNHGLRHHPDNEFANAFNAFADRKATMARRLGPEERVKPDVLATSSETLALLGKTHLQANPSKDWKVSAIFELAVIFCQYAPPDRFEDLQEASLPHSTASRFIKFVYAALDPFVLPSELSHGALSRLWLRQKKVMFPEVFDTP